jgi:hypothetical protein
MDQTTYDLSVVVVLRCRRTLQFRLFLCLLSSLSLLSVPCISSFSRLFPPSSPSTLYLVVPVPAVLAPPFCYSTYLVHCQLSTDLLFSPKIDKIKTRTRQHEGHPLARLPFGRLHCVGNGKLSFLHSSFPLLTLLLLPSQLQCSWLTPFVSFSASRPSTTRPTS